jgi:hypothetical protein
MGWAGVELLFILSGYLILVDSVARGHSLKKFACLALYSILTYLPG